MGILGKCLLIMSPIALLCSKNGDGIVLFLIFIILGLICLWLGKGGLDPKVRVKKDDWWEEMYMSRLGQNAARKEKPDARDDKIARDIANWSAGNMKCRMPSEEEKEQIARSMGVVTYKMIYDEEDRWNRIQVEKYRLMDKLYEKYKEFGWVKTEDYRPGKLGTGRMCCPYEYIKSSKRFLKEHISVWYGNQDPWTATPSFEEKNIAREWIEEYEQRLIREVNDYIEKGIPFKTINYHYITGHRAEFDYSEYNLKYGFNKRRTRV